jgi:uncharacterized membrane protein
MLFWFDAFFYVVTIYMFHTLMHKQENTKKHEEKQHRNKTQMRNMQSVTT